LASSLIATPMEQVSPVACSTTFLDHAPTPCTFALATWYVSVNVNLVVHATVFLTGAMPDGGLDKRERVADFVKDPQAAQWPAGTAWRSSAMAEPANWRGIGGGGDHAAASQSLSRGKLSTGMKQAPRAMGLGSASSACLLPPPITVGGL
jgi:hypothetical protein